MVRAAAGAAIAALMAGAMAGRATAQSSGTPWLGVTTQEITGDLREGLDYRGTGVLVNRVVRDSPADRAGIEKGDVIVSFNSRNIDSPSELSDVVRMGRVGQSVSITLIRDGSRRSVSARLAERSDSLDEDYWEAPATPESPRAPRAPSAPRAPRSPRVFNWDGDDFNLRNLRDFTMFGGNRGRLGVHIQDINADLGDALGVPDGKGVLVTDIVEDSPAEKAGIKAGDVITEVGGDRIDDIADLQRALREREGRTKITVVRRGSTRTVEPDIDDIRDVRRNVTRLRDGDARIYRIPDARTRAKTDMSDSEKREMESQLRELREELRELRQKLEEKDNRN
jgi:serine protease Do